ncbi:OmpL47-type beta-barrel domain-containing protein [Anaeromicropila populeti]|uniref:3-keto-alpha-glucoside-1,2-lyase/3-keto-2-hydroxy-glucal hydratase domain-containing protein n=1 Tax=Anaeromicropila populeti TaxID=37658 RepID=A0A1I6IEA0_9FIRM|nr:family 16 glycoside hydrolase [Anaeromicropila populeti]SFR65026.1 protein of unknown function [Anaeromicropila populeti]
MKKKILFAAFLLLLVIFGTAITSYADSFILTATPDVTNNCVSLNWTAPDAETNYSYMIYQQRGADENAVYQSIPAKDVVKVLEIYPKVSTLTGWVGSYGQGKITCTATTIEAFNANPSMIWNYDVIAFGFWDSNNEKDLTASSAAVLKQYIEQGYGVLFGHDTVAGNKASVRVFNNFVGYVNVELSPYTSGWTWPAYSCGGTTVTIQKKGLLTNYPYQIGDVGTVLTIPNAHTVGQKALGDVWMTFPTGTNLIYNAYLTTWNNCALIQTGHSSGAATVDEQKLIMNTLFYLAQKTSTTSWEDHMAQDLTGPSKPELSHLSIANTSGQISFQASSTDVGDQYHYYIEATAPGTQQVLTSSKVGAYLESGLSGYSYIINQSSNTIPDNIVDSSSGSITQNFSFTQKGYIHIKALDKAGNASETLHYELSDLTAPTMPKAKIIEKQLILIASQDLESGVSQYEYRLNGSDWVTWKGNINLTELEDGTYILELKAVDNMGNESEVYTFTFQLTYQQEAAAVSLVEKAELSENQTDIDAAYLVVCKLSEGEVKLALLKRLALIQCIKPKVDIKLAVGDTAVNIDSFKEDLYAELQRRGINTTNFNIMTTQQTTVSTEMEDAADIFNKWGRIGWTGQWSFDSVEKVIKNAENTDNFTGFYYPNNFSYRDIDFTYYNNTTNADDDVMGAMIKFNRNADGTVTTYVFSLDRGDNGGGVQTQYGGGGLYKIVNKPFEYTTVTLLQEVSAVWERNSWTRYHLVAKGNNIKVYQNEELLIDYTDNNNPIITGSYGFFSFSQPDAMYKDVTIVCENTQTLGEVLDTTVWSDNSARFIINLNDTLEEDLSDAGKRAAMVTKTKAAGAHYIGWGTSVNQQQSLQFISENNKNGIFVDNGNYAASVIEIADYIIKRFIFPEGQGTIDTPYIIRSVEQIESIKYDLSAYYRLEENIDLGGKLWIGLGSEKTPFTGGLNGNGCTISNFTMNSAGSEYIGFFGVIENSTITKINFTGVSVLGGKYVGVLAGYAKGEALSISHCSVEEVNVEGNIAVGGLIGMMEGGSMGNCSSEAGIYGKTFVGGLIGHGKGIIIKDCVSAATVTGVTCVGGILGYSDGNWIETSQSIATLVGNSKVGGLIGYNNGATRDGLPFIPVISECTSLATVKGDSYVGGIAGYCDFSNLKSCRSLGTLEGNENLGGLIGYSNEGNCTECDDTLCIMTGSNV